MDLQVPFEPEDLSGDIRSYRASVLARLLGISVKDAKALKQGTAVAQAKAPAPAVTDESAEAEE